ncbi:MAG: glycosyltransferase family 4 protein [Magnetococcales bacterium]|nr:glycosyltransferase family 4 protein [Magnetococcales bacterium]NGZ06650.1 glycosyltransferase family 4 protein [Magnetococcales bacterium]
MELEQVGLTLFFTAGLSLTEWERLGMLERETALYRALSAHGQRVSFVTYGDGRDLAYRERLPGIAIACNRWKLSDPWYWRWLAWMPTSWKRGKVVFKSNQVAGAETPLALARRFGKPFIARCGYLRSDFARRRFGDASQEAMRALEQERRIFRGADRVVVTTAAMAEVAVGEHGVAAERVRVIPNYVDTGRFAPRVGGQPGAGVRVLSVGRLDHQKAPLLLLEAAVGVPVEVVMIGDGPLRGEVTDFANAHGVRLSLPGVQPHGVLPEWMNGADLFVLASDYEGHPKALLEAMACGMAVIGRADAPGVREVIRHEETGLLCPGDAAGMRAAVVRLLADHELRGRLGRNARAYALATFSLDRVVALELALLREVMEERWVCPPASRKPLPMPAGPE